MHTEAFFKVTSDVFCCDLNEELKIQVKEFEKNVLHIVYVCMRACVFTVIWLPFEGRITANDILEENYSS